MASHLPQAQSFFLPNDLKVIHSRTLVQRIVCLQLFIKTGSANENEKPYSVQSKDDIDQSGYSHFIEHLTFKSTASYPLNGISDIVPRLGGSINAYTDFDCTCYHLLLPSECIETGIHILSEIAFNANWTEEDVRIEKDIIIEEIKQYEQDPEMDFVEYIQRHYWQDHPLKRPILGTAKSIKAAKHNDLIEFYRTHYLPNNAFLVVTGDFDEDKLHHYTDRFFSVWRSFPHPASSYEHKFMEPVRTGFEVHHRRVKTGLPILAIVIPELSDKHPQSDAMSIATQILCLGDSSILYQRLVENDKLCSTLKVHSISGVLTGITAIVLYPMKGVSHARIIEICLEELKRMSVQPLDLHEFDLVKKDLIYSWLYTFDACEHLASELANEECLGNHKRLYLYEDRIQQVDEQRVKGTISCYWQKEYIRIYIQNNVPAAPALDLAHLTDLLIKTAAGPFPVNPSCRKSPVQQSFPPCHRITASEPYSIQSSSNDQYHFYLSNGMKVVLHQAKLRQSVGIALATPISQLTESDDERGLNFLTSTALIYGSQFNDYQQVRSYSREHGIKVRVTHQTDCTTLKAKCLRSSIEPTLALLSELLYYPAFKPLYIGMIKRSVIDALRREADYPSVVAFNHWFRMLCGSRNNINRATANITDILKLRISNIKDWHRRFYAPANFTLCIAGSFDPEEMARICHKYFDLSVEDGDPICNKPIFQAGIGRRIIHSTQSAQAYIHLGGFGCSATDRKQNTAFHLLAVVLGCELNSRFYTILREKNGLAYQCGFEFNSFQQMGFWTAYAYSDADDWRQTSRLMHEIIDDVYANGISAEELQTAQTYLIGTSRFDEESVSWQACTIATLHALGYETDYYFKREERIREIDLDSIKALTRQWLSPSNRFLHIVH